MIARRAKNQNEIRVFVEVLQNGELLSRTSRSFHKPGVIHLTSNPDKELTAPFYPLPTDIELIKITKRGVEIDLDPNWEGFTTYEGKIEEISSEKRTNYTHIMKPGDYGSIAYNDLRVLIRIGRERPSKKHQGHPTGAYRGQTLGLWIGDHIERKMSLIAGVAGLWIFGCLVYGLLNRPDDRPKEIVDLQPEYTLPFIHPKHLKNLPEALQSHYKPNDIIGSAYTYFKHFAATIMNFPVAWHPGIHQNTYNMYEELYRTNRQTLNDIRQAQSRKEESLLQQQARAIVRIPTVHGESLNGSLLRLKDKLTILHENLETTLQSRIATTMSFRSDPGYDYETYQQVPNQQQPGDQPNASLAQLKPAVRAMYQEAENLAAYADYHQRQMRQARAPVIALTKTNHEPLGIPQQSGTVSYIHLPNFSGLNRKLEWIKAAEFDARRQDPIKEPLIGKLDPRLVEKTIEKNRFELQLCFELALRRNQQLAGEMEWRWRLDTRGRISELQLVESTIKDRRMIRCIRRKIARWKFPRPRRGSVQISYPFHFAPAKG
jgi:hypothetical protein